MNRRQFLKHGSVALASAAAVPGLSPLALGATDGPGSRSGRFPAAIVTPHPEGAAAAAGVLKQGGNAVDAAVAATMALCVVMPSSLGFGGYGGSMVVYLAKERRVTAIDFDSRAPLEFRPELFTDPKKAYHGYLAVGVPGIVAGFDLALRTFGTLPWKTVSQHALALASEGVILERGLRDGLEAVARNTDRTSFKALFPDGAVPTVGERWVQEDLAQLIRNVGDGGADAFYRGEIARTIVRQVRAQGGILSEEDFTRFQAQVVEPIRISYHGNDIFTPPVPSGGLTSLSILKTLEHFDLATLEPWGARYLHLLAEASKLCWAERFRQFGDPDVVKFSSEELLSSTRAAQRAEQIRAGRVASVNPGAPEATHTANVVITDHDQNVVSLTATHGGGFGSQVAIDGLGLVLGHGMSRFTLEPDSPNFPAPGERMQHNMAPTVILRDGRPRYVVGLPGGRMIVTVTAQRPAPAKPRTPASRELSLREVVAKHPDVPRLVIIKTDVQRRGVHYSERALAALDETKHQITGTHIFGARDGQIAARPESLLLRDGTSIITTPTPLEQNPYLVDVRGGRLVLADDGEVSEEVDYGLSRRQFVLNILIPAAFPSLLAGLKTGWAFAWRTLIAAELVFGVSAGSGGLGWFIYENKNLLETERVFAGLGTVILIGLAVDVGVFRVLENRTVWRWGMKN